MKILATIKAALKKAGIPEKYAGKVQKLFNIESEENLETYIALFKENILPDIEEVEGSVKTAAEAAAKKAIEDYEKQHNLKDGKAIKPEKPEETKTDDLPPAVKVLIEAQGKQISELTGVVNKLANSVTTSQKQSSAAALFKEAKLPEKWLSRIDVNSEKSVEDQIKELQEEWTELRQSVIDDQVETGDYRPNQYKPKERTEKEWADFMNGDKETSKDASVASLGLD
ncbi:hypothetical protein JN06_01338 [Bacteroides zoogleoformans]|uniref:Uncharacterized protein n=1 Tax=Bacteroides zoogleoformans TaxID=28119 RepID=A0ABM6T9Q2_9BACE|nr:hypothetical protein [Bacteroides zoogleoformans]AVM53305.1 hypothetical protein C4H11_10525 [Bacteroides zoogleoformans]TWJ14405.1 hypothetical protein JN06_01338 [Bacteroides zoogleoformans]